MRSAVILSLALSFLRFGSNASNTTSEVADLFPNLEDLPSTGSYAAAYIDPISHKIVQANIESVSKHASKMSCLAFMIYFPRMSTELWGELAAKQ